MTEKGLSFGSADIIPAALVFLTVTAAEELLARRLGRREEIFSFWGRRHALLLAGGNLLLLCAAFYREAAGGHAAVWYFGIWTYLFCTAIYDLKCRELPDLWLLLPACFYAAAWLFGYQPAALHSSLFTVFLLSAVLGLIYLIRKDAIGLGDIKLILICALYLGGECAGMLLRGMTAAFICSMALLLMRRATAKSELPFVPFLLLGALLI